MSCRVCGSRRGGQWAENIDKADCDRLPLSFSPPNLSHTHSTTLQSHSLCNVLHLTSLLRVRSTTGDADCGAGCVAAAASCSAAAGAAVDEAAATAAAGATSSVLATAVGGTLATAAGFGAARLARLACCGATLVAVVAGLVGFPFSESELELDPELELPTTRQGTQRRAGQRGFCTWLHKLLQLPSLRKITVSCICRPRASERCRSAGPMLKPR